MSSRRHDCRLRYSHERPPCNGSVSEIVQPKVFDSGFFLGVLERCPNAFNIPPTHKLGGDREHRRLWVLLMMVQASANVHEIERQWLAIHHKAHMPRHTATK